MVRNISEEEVLLRKRARRRLVGAITLVILSVVFLPMILDDEPRQEQQEIDILIPSEELADDAYPWMMPEDAPASGEATLTPDPDKPLPFSDPEYSDKMAGAGPDHDSIGGVPIPARKPSFAHPAVQGNAVVNSVKTPEGAYVIQLGAFSDVSKARQQQENLVASGISAYTETIKVGHNEMTRVRIGPFATREIAENEHERLKKIGLSGVVTSR